jgi:hypothetical protein
MVIYHLDYWRWVSCQTEPFAIRQPPCVPALLVSRVGQESRGKGPQLVPLARGWRWRLHQGLPAEAAETASDLAF